jgi:uncharacterized protein (DUF1800 family)
MKTTLLRFYQLMIAGLVAATPLLAVAAQAPAVSEVEALRFLRQSTFGPTTELVAAVQKIGFTKFLTKQFKMKGDNYPKLKSYPEFQPQKCNEKCVRDNYTYYQLQRHFFESALEGKDQLRQRVAFALSQILVTSQGNVPMPAWMRTYQEVLYDHAFGNYRQLLYEVTLNPAMGRYLDMLNNRCQTRHPVNLPANQELCRNGFNSQPNENYAREILQLFSIGTFLLNQDGTYQVDAQGMPIPTYDQTTVEEFARVFTGWTLAPEVKFGRDTVPNYKNPMVVYLDRQGRQARHDRGPKILLNDFVVPAQTPAAQELNMAIDNIIGHSNVAPAVFPNIGNFGTANLGFLV